MSPSSGVSLVADPLGGSYYVENLTDRVEEEALSIMAEVDELGGAVACIESGYMQRLIQDEAYRVEQRIADGEKVIVGVNKYTETEEPGAPLLFRPDERVMREQLARLEEHRRSRDGVAAAASLAALRTAAGGEADLMPHILDAVRAEATLGEICGTLRDVFGDYHPPALV